MKFFTFFFLITTLWSCTGSTSNKIPLEELDDVTRKQSDMIIGDFVSHSISAESFKSFKNKDYITTMVYRMSHADGIYSIAPILILSELGKINSYELFEVIDKGLVKKMRYKLSCDKRNNEFIELAIDLNHKNQLAKIYLYVHNNGDFSLNQERINLFSSELYTTNKKINLNN